MRSTIFKSKKWPSLAYRAALWHFRYYLAGRSSPLSAACFVTNRCNLRCTMCNIWRSSPKMTIDMRTYQCIVDSLASMGTFYFSLTGGEPFLLPDIFERLAYAAKRLPFVHTISNGWAFDEGTARELAATGIDEISFSLDGDEEYHDALRGMSGSFRRVIAAIEAAKSRAPRVKIVVNTLIGPDNSRQIPPLISMLEEMKVRMKVQPITVHPSFGNTAPPNTAQKRDEAESIRSMADALRKSPIVANSGYFLSLIEPYFAGRRLDGGGDCILPCFHMEIMWNGKIYPCLGGTGWEGGFDPKPSVIECVRSSPYRKAQRDLRSCRRCDRNLQICYWEPRITFPVHKLVRFLLLQMRRR